MPMPIIRRSGRTMLATLVGAGVLAVAPAAAAAQATAYTSRAAFLAALTTPPTTFGFEGIATSFFAVPISGIGPLTFTPAAFAVPVFNDPPMSIGSGAVLVLDIFRANPTVVGSTIPLHAVGIDVGTFEPVLGPFCTGGSIAIPGQGVVSADFCPGTPPLTRRLVGLISAVPFTEFRLAHGMDVSFDDLRIAGTAGPSVVPEPATFGVVDLGLGALAAARCGRGRRDRV